MRATEMTAAYHLIDCPVCGAAIRAEVTVEPKLSTPTMISAREASINVKANLTRFNVKHACMGRAEKQVDPEDGAA